MVVQAGFLVVLTVALVTGGLSTGNGGDVGLPEPCVPRGKSISWFMYPVVRI